MSMADTKEANNSLQLAVIKVVIFIAFFSMSLPYSILPGIFIHSNIQMLSFFRHYSDQTNILLAMSAYPFGMFFGSYILGTLSDKVGKRRVLLFGLAMAGTFQVFCAMALMSNRIFMFTIFRFLCGFFEGNISVARSFIATLCADAGERKKQLGQAGIALTLGWVLGPPIGMIAAGVEAAQIPELPFFLGAILVFSGLVFAYLFFEEPNACAHQPSSQHFPLASNKIDRQIVTLLIIAFLILLGVDSFYVFIPVFLAVALKASSKIIALSSVMVGGASMFSNLIVLPWLHNRINTRNTIILSAGLLSTLLLIIYTLDPGYYVLILSPFMGVFIALLSTNIVSYLSGMFSKKRQGLLMGIISSQRTLGAAILSVSYAFIAGVSLKFPFFVGFVFLMSGALFLLLLF